MKVDVRHLLALALLAPFLGACTTRCDETVLFFSDPANTSPLSHTLVGDLRPTLTWNWSVDCSPTEYHVNLWTNATNGTTADTGFGGNTGSTAKDWSPASDLTPGTAYIWQVAAMNGTYVGLHSEWWEFIVGPACEAAGLVAPSGVSPVGDITGVNPTYIWDYSDPTCTPEGYALQVSENASFTSLVVNLRDDNPVKAWSPGVVLNDCDQYWWRVGAIDGPSDGPWSPSLNFRPQVGGGCLCLAMELAQPVPVLPPPYAIVPNLLPTLEWTFPGSCLVEGFGVHLSKESDFSDTSLFGGTGTPNTRWMPGKDLEPHTQYYWEVFAGVGTDFGEPSSLRSFFTGPECTAVADLVAPELLSPIGGEPVTDGFAKLRFQPGDDGCIPDGYFVNLQTDPDFLGNNLLGEYSLPATTVLTDPLEDCTIHYWKVAAIQDGTRGPESASEWFYTNQAGTCPEPTPPEPTPPMIRFRQNAFCRRGPGTEYGEAAGYETGQEAKLIGRSEPGRAPWWMTDLRCWVADSTGETRGPVDDLPIIKAPPLPTAGPVCTDKITTAESCKAAGGTWTIRPGNFTSVQYYCLCRQ